MSSNEMSLKQTINKYYEMVNLQIAAEAMWKESDRASSRPLPLDDNGNIDNNKILADGNFRSTKFANEAEAKVFLDKYDVVEHIPKRVFRNIVSG